MYPPATIRPSPNAAAIATTAEPRDFTTACVPNSSTIGTASLCWNQSCSSTPSTSVRLTGDVGSSSATNGARGSGAGATGAGTAAACWTLRRGGGSTAGGGGAAADRAWGSGGSGLLPNSSSAAAKSASDGSVTREPRRSRRPARSARAPACRRGSSSARSGSRTDGAAAAAASRRAASRPAAAAEGRRLARRLPIEQATEIDVDRLLLRELDQPLDRCRILRHGLPPVSGERRGRTRVGSRETGLQGCDVRDSLPEEAAPHVYEKVPVSIDQM